MGLFSMFLFLAAAAGVARDRPRLKPHRPSLNRYFAFRRRS
jgi:hypothetical protein